MVEEKKDKGYVDGSEMTIKEVVLKVNRNNDQEVEKVIFEATEDKKITWKPKVEKSSYQGGFKVLHTVPMERDMLPKKLQEMAMICSEKGQCKVKAFYNWWETEQDGNKVTYRFMTSQRTFDKWEIIKEEVKTEEVEAK